MIALKMKRSVILCVSIKALRLISETFATFSPAAVIMAIDAGKTDGGHDAPQVTCRFEACESGHIDADGTGRRLGNGDHIRDIRMAEPMGLVGHFIEEGKRSEPPADRKQSGFEKLEKKL